MRCKPVVQTVILFTVALCFFCPQLAKSQNVFEAALVKKIDSITYNQAITAQQELYPNDNATGIVFKRITQTATSGYCLINGAMFTQLGRNAVVEICNKK